MITFFIHVNKTVILFAEVDYKLFFKKSIWK